MESNKKNVKIQIGKNTLILLFIVFIAVLAAFFMSADRNPVAAVPEITPTTLKAVDEVKTPVDVGGSGVKVEVIHFHTTNQCWSCITLGDLAEKTVNTYYKDELESGKLVFDHIDGQKAENRELVLKYGARGSALFIGTYVNGEFHGEENVQLWYKLNNEEGYMSYLKELLDKRLNGDLS